VAYIMSLATRPKGRLACVGLHAFPGSGTAARLVLLRAAYTDPGRTACRRSLRTALALTVADGHRGKVKVDGVSKQTDERAPFRSPVANRSGSSVALKQIDLRVRP